jgi:hypothetical protein
MFSGNESNKFDATSLNSNSSIPSTTVIKDEIGEIMNKCRRVNVKTKRNISKINDEIETYSMCDEKFKFVVNTLRELEGSDANIIESMFNYKVEDNEKFIEEAQKITRDFKSGLLDPSRKIKGFDKKAAKK